MGSPDTVIRRLAEQQALTGHTVFCAQHLLLGMPSGLVDKSLRLFGQEVIPAFR